MSSTTDTPLRNVIVMGLSFLLLFSAFNSFQSLQTSILQGNSGFITLCILYATLAFGNAFFAAPFVRKFGEKASLLLGGVTYIAFCVVQLVMLMVPDTPDAVKAALYYTVSFVLGVGASIMWTAQGSLVALSCTESTRARNNGIFFALFMGNFFTGGCLTQFVLNAPSGSENHLHTLQTLSWILSSLSVVAVASFFFIKNDASISSRPGYSFSPLETLRLFKDPYISLLSPVILYSGISAGYFYGIYTAHVGTKWIGYSMLCFGAFEVAGSLAASAADRVGRTPVFLVAVSLALCGYFSSLFSLNESITNPTASQIVAMFFGFALLGASDAGFNTMLYADLGARVSEEKAQAAIAFFKAFQNVGTAIAFAYGPFISPKTQQRPLLAAALVCVSVLIVGTIGWLIAHRCFARNHSTSVETATLIQEPQ